MATQTRTKQSSTKQGNIEANKKGVTKTGTPRQRAYRTYYGVTTTGIMVRYPSYEAREIACKREGVERLTAHEVRAREVLGEQAVNPQAAKAALPISGTMPSRLPSQNSAPIPQPTHNAKQSSRQLIHTQLLLSQAVNLLADIQQQVDGLTNTED